VGRISNECDALRGDLRRVVKAERKGRPRREHRDVAEEAAHRRLRLSREILVGEREPTRRVFLRNRPDDCGPVIAGWIVCHRQKREGTGWKEDLVSDIFMGPVVPNHRNDRLMVVFPPRDANAGSLASHGVAPVGCNQQGRAQLAAVLERDVDAVIASLDTRSARSGSRARQDDRQRQSYAASAWSWTKPRSCGHRMRRPTALPDRRDRQGSPKGHCCRVRRQAQGRQARHRR
jgi:hypothetical protein